MYSPNSDGFTAGGLRPPAWEVPPSLFMFVFDVLVLLALSPHIPRFILHECQRLNHHNRSAQQSFMQLNPPGSGEFVIRQRQRVNANIDRCRQLHSPCGEGPPVIDGLLLYRLVDQKRDTPR